MKVKPQHRQTDVKTTGAKQFEPLIYKLGKQMLKKHLINIAILAFVSLIGFVCGLLYEKKINMPEKKVLFEKHMNMVMKPVIKNLVTEKYGDVASVLMLEHSLRTNQLNDFYKTACWLVSNDLDSIYMAVRLENKSEKQDIPKASTRKLVIEHARRFVDKTTKQYGCKTENIFMHLK